MNCEIQKQEPVATQNPETTLATEARVQSALVTRRPAYRVAKVDNAFRVEVDLPGVDREAIALRVEAGVLKVSAAREFKVADLRTTLVREIPDVEFSLNLELKVSIDEGKVTARLENGTLKILLPLAEAALPRSIAIE
ncbi:MAG: Hsp20/alpha crystallin family protein [Puniceicoccaceae bacterium]